MRYFNRLVILAAAQLLAAVPACADAMSEKESSAISQQESYASREALEKQIQQLDRRALLELIKLAEFNVRYEQAVSYYARWRTFVYPALQEAAYACYLGYSVNDIVQESKGWKDPRTISPTAVKRGLSSALVGAVIGGGSSILELAANGSATIQSSRNGYSSRAAVSTVKAASETVDGLLARRHNLMVKGQFTGAKQELLALKEELLKYERQRLVFEFKRWNAHSRGYAWYKNSFYAINATVNMARFSAVLLGFKSFSSKGFAGAIGPLLISSATLAGLGPLGSSTIGNQIQKYQEKKLAKHFPSAGTLSDETAKQKFERLAELLSDPKISGQHSLLLAELVRLREEKIGLDRLIYGEEKNINRFRLVAGQQAKTAPAISTLAVTSGILNTVGYYGYRQEPVVNNRLGFAADAALIPAEIVALYATPFAAIKTETYERDLRKRGEHPTQLLSKRLADLKTLEDLLQSDSQ